VKVIDILFNQVKALHYWGDLNAACLNISVNLVWLLQAVCQDDEDLQTLAAIGEQVPPPPSTLSVHHVEFHTYTLSNMPSSLTKEK